MDPFCPRIKSIRCLVFVCVCVHVPQYLNLLENCCGNREGSVLILLCDICEYLSDTFDGASWRRNRFPAARPGSKITAPIADVMCDPEPQNPLVTLATAHTHTEVYVKGAGK